MFVPAFFGLLLAAFVSGQSVDISPREAVRRIGDDLTVLCKVPYPIDSCRMTVGTTPYRLKPENNDDDVVYSGQGLQFGECGAHIRNIRDEWNGNISCVLPPQTGNIEQTANMRLVVARAPEAPQLVVSSRPTFVEGDQLIAMCVVPNGRPAAKITWFLDDEQLLVGTHQPIVESVPNTDLLTIRANVTRRLSADDGGRRLVCKSEHEAMDKPVEAAKQLIVYYPPRLAEGTGNQINIFGLKIGSEGRLNVTVRASPPPLAVWKIAGEDLTAPARKQDQDIDVTALEPVSLGNGFYNLTLVIREVKTADVQRPYYLTARNDLGQNDFRLKISTAEMPEDVGLGTGGIVGIVIAVLVVIIAISLLIFAKATDRWCFAGGRERGAAKSSGESDTESAAGAGAGRGRVQRARAAVVGTWGRVRDALPRRDKVQASEQPADVTDKPMEKKEGVVYAELALAETGNVPEPTRPSTEYAEIVYTDQGQKEAKE